jgi:hypothetical protein
LLQNVSVLRASSAALLSRMLGFSYYKSYFTILMEASLAACLRGSLELDLETGLSHVEHDNDSFVIAESNRFGQMEQPPSISMLQWRANFVVELRSHLDMYFAFIEKALVEREGLVPLQGTRNFGARPGAELYSGLDGIYIFIENGFDCCDY